MNQDKLTEDCLIKMFKAVGLDKTFPEIMDYAKQDDWYWTKTWTKDQEDSFASWMDAEMKKRTSWTDRQRKREIGMFLLMWGWKRGE